MESFFQILGIEPTKDEKQIKKVYRTLLHKVNPEDDAEGFKQLREAYEQACNYARLPEEKEKAPQSGIDIYINRCEELYRSFFQRIRTEEWEYLFKEAEEFDLEQEEQLRSRFLTFLMGHFHLPFPVWQRIDRIFRISGCREELMEHFPEGYVDFLLQAVQYEGTLNYELFEGDPEADFDEYIENYQKLRQFTDMGMVDQAGEVLREITSSSVYHPYTELEQVRLLIQSQQEDEAGRILSRLAKKYDTEERIVCCYAQYLGLTDRWEEAGELYDRLLSLYPESFSAKEGKAEVLLHQERYRDSREMILDLLETNPQDERLMKDLNDTNEYMIRELEEALQSGVLDQDGLMDLAWCYYQNMRLDDGIALMDSFKPDEEHELDYHNLKGRIFLTMEKDREALGHLIPWLEAIKKLKPDGTKKTKRRLARLGYAYYTIGAAKAGLMLAEKKGDLSEAMAYFERAVEEEKDFGQAISYQHTMADIWRQKKDYNKVLRICEEILKANPGYYPAILLRQEACLYLGMYQECAEDFQRAVNLYPYYGKPYATLMKMYFLFGDYEKAGEVLKRAESMELDSDDLSVMKARFIAVTAHSQDDLARALAILDEKKVKGWDFQSDLDQEEWQEINFRRGLILSDLGRLPEAREAFEEALTKREDSGLLYSYASLLMRLEDYEEAVRYLKKTLKLTPQDVTVLYKLGWCYKEKGNYDYAVPIMKNVLMRNPEHAFVRMALTELYERLARDREDNSYYDLALPLMQEQLSRYPDAYHHIEMGLLYLDMDQYEEALSHFLKSIEQDPENIYAYNNAGNCCLSLENPKTGIRYFEKAIELMEQEGPPKSSPLPYNNLAKCYRMMEKYEPAITCYQKNLAMFPEEEDTWLSLTDCLREQERYPEAMEVCQEGISKVKYTNALECALLRLYGEMDDRGRFISYADELILKYPDNPVLLQLIGETWLYGFEEYDYSIYYVREALDHIKDGASKLKECERGCWYLYGRALLAMGETQRAQQAFMRYLSQCQDKNGSTQRYESFYGESRRRRFRMGCALWFLGKYDRAQEYFGKVLNYPCRCDGCSKPDCYEGRIGQAMMLYSQGVQEDAILLYKQAIKSAPNDMEHRFELRKLYANPVGQA